MATIPEALAVAIDHHRANRLNEAEQLYRQILEQVPNHPHAWHFLGVIANQVGKHEVAVQCLQRALAVLPEYAEAHCDLGNALKELARPIDAIACYQRALQFKPNYAEAHYNLANVFQAQHNLDEAIASYRRALELRPDLADAHNNLGLVHRDQKRLDEAVASFRRALELQPDLAEAHCNLGLTLRDQEKTEQATACFRRAIELQPNHAEAHYHLGISFKVLKSWDEAVASYRRAIDLNPAYADAHTALGVALQAQGNLDEAIACHRRALELQPRSPELLNNLATALQQHGRLDEAVSVCRQALELQPDLGETHVNLGNILRRLGRLDEAAASYRRAIERKPDYSAAHLAHSTLLLLTGDFEHGWPQYEWRWKTAQISPREFPQPLWNGEPLEGRTILLHAEQGFGDTLQFIRYATLVKARGAVVIVECPPPLKQLLASSPGIDRLVPFGDELPPFDVHAPLLSLPAILKTTLETIPKNVPYLLANPALIQQWKGKLSSLPGFRIGINWRGREGHGEFRNRDIPFALISSLAQKPGISLISLQRGASRRELADPANRLPIFDPGDDVDTAGGAFTDTAAIMVNLDLVITSDTAIPHLAGALGVPTWLALPFAPDWRWLLNRDDSPWYPTMHLFRQQKPGDWLTVFNEIQQALHQQP